MDLPGPQYVLVADAKKIKQQWGAAQVPNFVTPENSKRAA